MKKIASYLPFLPSAALLVASMVPALVQADEADPAITGKIKIKSSLKKEISPTAALYIIARPAGATSGPPAAVKRFAGPFQFPIAFSISKKDAMMPDTPFEGKFTVTARISQSGSATPVNPGDIQSKAPSAPVAPGDKPIVIELNEVRK